MGKLNHPGKATFAGMWNMLVKYLYYFILLSAYIFFFNLKNGECTRIGGSGLNKTTRKVKAKRICIRRGIPEDTG